MSKDKIKAIDENGNIFTFNNLKEASEAIGMNTRMEKWKIQLYIAYAVNTKTRAFKYKWMPVK